MGTIYVFSLCSLFPNYFGKIFCCVVDYVTKVKRDLKKNRYWIHYDAMAMGQNKAPRYMC